LRHLFPKEILTFYMDVPVYQAEILLGQEDLKVPGEQDKHPEPQSGPTQTNAADKGTVVDEPLHLLVQGMRQLQQAYLGKTDSKDTEVKGSVEIPVMPDLGAEASVAFADWLYELEQAVGGLSDKASMWFTACLEVARQAYVQYTMASPLTRLSLQPTIPEELKDQKWARLERRVMTLLLGAMKRPAKEDAITHRIADVPSLLYRLHALYQPGGVSERAAVLKHLEGRLGGEDVHECVAALRKWRRYVERAEAMNVTVPDSSILLGAVELMVKKVLAAHPEVKFRTDLMKNELQLQGRPTLDGVLRFHTHVLAELQMIAPVSMSSTSAALKAIGAGQAGTGEAIMESIQAASRPAEAASSSSQQALPASSMETSTSRDGEVKELLKEANAMLRRLTKLQALEVQTNTSVGELSAAIKAAGLEGEEGFALLDSGASHAFKTAERVIVEQASPVRVELAGGQNRAGTLLAAADDPQAAGATSILPLGALVQQLGCELTWTRKGGLKVVHPEFGVLKTLVKGNHPMLAETQALEIISQLEEQHLQSLEASTAETFVRTLDYEEMKSWDFMLGKFVATGGRECLLEALSSSCSPLGELSSDVLSLAAAHVVLDDKQGWKYLKALPLNRNMRKSMMTRRWVVRLYRREGEADLQISNSEDVVTVDCNFSRSKRFSIKGESAMYKALMWAAARGQIEGVLGSPPVNDGHELLAKQLLLWAVSRQAAFMHGASPPYLLLGSTPSSSMWRSEMWSSFRQEYHVPMMQVETDEDGSNYLIAMNLAMKGGLLPPDSVEVSEGLTTKAWPNVWKLPFQHDLGFAVDRWRLRPDEMFLGYMLHKLDSDTPWSDKDLRYWKRHVANGHLPFDRRFKTCIQTAATGRAHRRIIAPSCYTLSLDVCGPFRKKGEYGGSKGFRYALIGTYLMPKLSVYKDVPIPEEPEILSDAEGPEGDFLDEHGPADLPLDPEDQEDLDKSNKRFQALYKEVGDTMEYQTLHYAVPLKTRLTPEIEDAVKQIYLQSAQKLFFERLAWTRLVGVCGLPVYGTGGHFDLDERWQGGVYVGPSHELRQGHVEIMKQRVFGQTKKDQLFGFLVNMDRGGQRAGQQVFLRMAVYPDCETVMGAKQFAAIAIQRNGGGGLWTQLENEETSAENEDIVVKEVKPGGMKYNLTREKETVCEGGCKDGDQKSDSQVNKDEKDGCGSSLLILNEIHHQLLEDLQERSRSLRLLMEEEHMLTEDLRQAGKLVEEETEKVQLSITQRLKHASQQLSRQDRAMLKVCLRAASEVDEPDYEHLLESLQGDLQVVHTVPLCQVKPVVDRWHAAIRKELDNLFQGEARRLERQGVLRLVPRNGVHTLKPPANKSEKYKRKYRLVLCGNFAAPEEQFGSLYAGGASAETFRTVLAIAATKGWLGATADITGAFLLAPWPDHLHRYAVAPPRLLIDNGYVSEQAYWLVLRPLYGLRESPAIWASYRSARFSNAKILYEDKYLVLKMSKVDSELWLIFFEGEEDLLGCLITYVDDLFYVAARKVVKAVHAWILEEWPCNELEWAAEGGGTRYLGMEVFQRPSGAYEIHQKGYILDLLRSHGMDESPGTLLPCPREWLSDDISPEPEDFSEAELRFGQRMVGEQLWLTMRCRPDLQFVVGHMAQWVSKHPRKVARVAKRVLAYLLSTADLKLVLGDRDILLEGYSDSSFAPYGERSYGASVVTVNGSPVAWKSGKQGMVTLSTMESELLEATNAVTLLECVGCLVDEIYTVRDQVHGGQDICVSVALLFENKYNELLDLLHQWGFEGLSTEAVQLHAIHVVMIGCMVVVLERFPGAEAADQTFPKDPIASAGVDELLLVSGCVAVIAVLIREFVKWMFRCARRSVKRESKLRRLRELARLAAEVEIDRLQTESQTPSSSDIHQAVQTAFYGSSEETGSFRDRSESNQDPVTPPATRLTQARQEELPRTSPGIASVSSVDDEMLRCCDRERLCRDTLSLLSVEALKAGLRQESMTLSGLKPELVARLALKIIPDPSFAVHGRELPTDRQLKYVLWLWKHGKLRTKCNLQYTDVASKDSISRWIHAWKGVV
ncbi:RE1, partial [Symbiodinium pilosum]